MAMNIRNTFIAVIFVVTLILVKGSVLDGETQILETSPMNIVSESLGANAPWINSEIDTPGDTGQYTSIAIDPTNGAIFISYYDATNHELRLASNIWFTGECDTGDGPLEGWGCRSVGIEGVDVGKYSSIAVDPTGGFGVAFYDATNGHLKYAHWENPHLSVYTIYTVDKGIPDISNVGMHTSLKYDDTGIPFISYYFDNPSGVDALMVAHYSYTGNCGYPPAENEWYCSSFITGEGVGQYTSIEVRNNFDVYIAYYVRGNGELWFVKPMDYGNCGFYGNTSACYPITGSTTDTGRYASMYLDDSDHFHIAYYDATNHTLKYAVEVDSGGNCGILGSAQCDTIDAMPVDTHPLGISIAEDAAGYPIIAYQSAFGSLNVARPLNALELPAGSGNCGPEIPLATWYCETVNPANQWIPAYHGYYLSIDMNPDGLAAIAYYGFITSSGGNLDISYQSYPQVLNFLPMINKNPWIIQ
jgi:hypothetical protein